MANVNPPPIRVPDSLQKDPELFQFYQAMLFHLQQLWRRTGGGEDFVEQVLVSSGGALSVSPQGKQNHTPTLESIGFLGTAADKGLYTTGIETYAEFDLTAFARTILDDASEATFKATVNLEIGTDVQAYSANLDEAGTFFGSTDISAAEAETLTDGSNADSLHVHSTTGISDVTSGTYTPTLTNVTNLDASTAYTFQYMRVGSVITVSGKLDINPTAASAIELGVSLPVSSNFTAAEQCGGTAAARGILEAYAVEADATNNRAQVRGVATATTNHEIQIIFQYRIL